MFAPCNFHHVTTLHCAVVQRHDENSEGLPRRLIAQMVQKAAVGDVSLYTATNSWDRTIHKYGKDNGLLTGYVKPQAGTSKRTTAGNVELQKLWYGTVGDVQQRVEERAMEVLNDADLVRKILPFLFNNLDEECLHAIAGNEKVVGSKRMGKHNNQNNSSRFANTIIFAYSEPVFC